MSRKKICMWKDIFEDSEDPEDSEERRAQFSYQISSSLYSIIRLCELSFGDISQIFR